MSDNKSATNFQDSELINKSLFDNSLDGLAYYQMVFDAQGFPSDFIYLQVNKNFEKLSGLKDVEGKKVTEIIPDIKTTNPELFEIFGRVSLSGEPEKLEIFVAPLAKWFLISAYSPKKGYLMTAFQNITDQKKIEKELNDAKVAAVNVLEDLQAEKVKLAEAKAKDDALLESIGDGVVATDQEGKVIFMNRVAEDLLGFSSSEIIGKFFDHETILLDIEGKKVEGNLRPITLALNSGAITRSITGTSSTITTTTSTTSTSTTDFLYIKKNGLKFHASITATPVIIDSKTIGAIAVFRDISKEKEIEHAKSEFISIASHQLRTPVSGLSWLIEALESGASTFPPKQRKYVGDLSILTKRLVVLLEDLLNFSRIELKTESVAGKERIEIHSFVEEFIKEMQPYVDLKHHKIVFNDSLNGSFPIDINKKSLYNVLQNLVTNAIDFSPEKTPITINLEKSDGYIKISITNQGPAIPKEDQLNIFKKFFRSESAKKIKPAGTGLGLYIVKAIIEGIGGNVGFTSQDGQGTVFWFTIPLKT